MVVHCAVHRSRQLAFLAPLSVLAVACELEEITVPDGEPVIVVQAVLRPDLPDQFIIVERSLTGVTQFPVSEPIPPDAPKTPVSGAAVSVANLDYPNDPCGNPVLFTEQTFQETGETRMPGVYLAPAGCPNMRAGDRLVLRVDIPQGETVSGTTRVPGLDGIELTAGGESMPFGGAPFTFNRDQDTLRIAAQPTASRLLQVEVRRARLVTPRITRTRVNSDVSLRLFVDTTAVTLPGDLLHVFERGAGQDVFRGGRLSLLVVGAADSNYYDFVRSSNSDFSGRGFINHLVGGIGVFGSLVAAAQEVLVLSDQEDAREGVYRLQGTIFGTDVDIEIDLYLARPTPMSEFSALVTGTWVDVGVEPSMDGTFRGDTLTGVIESFSIAGAFSAFPFDTVCCNRLTISGVRVPGSPFDVAVLDHLQRTIAVLTATQ